MKKTLFLCLVLAVTVSGFIFTRTSNEISVTRDQTLTAPPSGQSNNITPNFIFGAIETRRDGNFTNMNDMGLNLWHTYVGEDTDLVLGRHVPSGWTADDRLTADISAYQSGVRAILQSIDDNNHGIRSFLQRPKIEWLCFGQRSDYRCVDVSIINQETPDIWFYSFQSPGHVGSDVLDNSINRWVRYCQATVNSPGEHPVVSRLRTNNEQCVPTGGGNEWQGDGECDWLIKPRIKIDSNIAHNNQEMNVCRVKVLASDGLTVLKDEDIKAKFFLDQNNNYDGKYLEEFYFNPNLPASAIQLHGCWGDGRDWSWRSRGDWVQDSVNSDFYRCKADIQVSWYGNCDMWIDYVRVDNDVADQLFKGVYEQPGKEWLKWEAQNIAGGLNTPLKFYIELSEFNNIPCIAYVSHKLDSLSEHRINMISDITPYYAHHINWDDHARVINAGHVLRNYIQKVDAKEIFMESYPLTGRYMNPANPDPSITFSRIPNTLPVHNAGASNILALPIAPALYDDWLQNQLNHSLYALEPGTLGPMDQGEGPLCNFSNTWPPQDDGNFRFTMQLAREVSRQANIPFIYMQQAHHWFKPGEVRREPTKEELWMLSSLAVSYGAKGIVYYWYANHANGNNSNCDFSYGLTTTGNEKRLWNVYGQSKWNFMRDTLIPTIKKWDQ